MNVNLNTTPNSVQEPAVLNMSGAARKRFLINGDPNKVLELNVTDLGIVERSYMYLPKLDELANKASQLRADLIINEDESEFNDEGVTNFTTSLKEYDKEMRKYLDLIFNARVSEVCDCGGTMYDPINGQFRYESIMSDLYSVCGDSLQNEFKQMTAKRASHTKKYTNKKK